MKKFKFGKKAIEKLPTPEKGKRTNYGDTGYPYLYLRVTPTSRTFFWQRTIKGKKVVITIDQYPAISPEVARTRAEQISADYTLGTDVAQEIKEDRHELTLGEAFADYRVNRVRGNGKISRSGDQNFKREFTRWENRPLSDITWTDCRTLFLKIKSRAPIHCNRIYALGSAIYNHAIKEMQWQGVNPWSFSKVSESGRERKNYRLFKRDMPAFIEALKTIAPEMRMLFLTSLFTSRRMGECKRMRWTDLNLDEGTWILPQYMGEERTGKFKNDSQLCVLPKQLIVMLKEYRRIVMESPWVFPSKTSKSGHVVEYRSAWDQVRSCGFQNLNANDLRGTMGSWTQDVGLSLSGAAQQMGHSNTDTTSKYYTSVPLEVQRIGVEAAVEDMLKAAGNNDKK